eukprot:TRINITY_DN8915_c0_g1_i3.p1 TRINITY_DN8915_c0_g1~~TRINITY_DN8915_c0_g1_i3.p1  ORF type:complete len:462 (-),score=45.34 TRINITY_DN8915_c0_g1_i3:428-1813(-)
MNFDEVELEIKGNAPKTYLKKKLTFFFNVTDQHFTVSTTLVISFKFSLTYFLQIFSYLVGPFTVMIALFSYRYLIYELFCQKKYQNYITYDIYENKPFQIIVPLVKNDLTIAKRIWNRVTRQYILKPSPDNSLQDEAVSGTSKQYYFLNSTYQIYNIPILEEIINQEMFEELKRINALQQQDQEDLQQPEQFDQNQKYQYSPDFYQSYKITTLYVILQCFVYEQIINSYPLANSVIQQLEKAVPQNNRKDTFFFINIKQKNPIQAKKNIFPHIIFNNKLLFNEYLAAVYSNLQINQEEQQNYLTELIKSYIVIKYYGISYVSTIINPGISVNSMEREITLIQARDLQHRQPSCCYQLYNPIAQNLKLNYQPIPLCENQYIPSWMKVRVQHSIVHLYGKLAIMGIQQTMAVQIYAGQQLVKELRIHLHKQQNLQKNIASDYKYQSLVNEKGGSGGKNQRRKQ